MPAIPLFRRRRGPDPAPQGAAPCVVPAPAAPGRGAVTVVVLVIVLGAVLFAAGHPAGAVLGLLAGTGCVGTETARRLRTAA